MANNKVVKRIFEIIEKSEKNDAASFSFDIFLIALIVANVSADIAGSFTTFARRYYKELRGFEIFSVVIFTIEYALRVLTSNYKYPETKHPRIKFFFSGMAMVDLLSILPFWLPFVTNVDLRFLRLLRLLRISKVLKLNRYNNAMEVIGRVIKNEKEKIITTLFLIFIMLLLASSAMYYIENAVQPDQFPNILATIWWAVATLTTVGYGDVYPITVVGKLLGGIIAILGIGIVALPTGIISSGFMKELGKEQKTCPHCGKTIG